ncbi:hypothetical protein EcWSU1_00638 [Enterobacter ludwigii]|uniref:Uncharacterized protein n=1 Tax=Enterobacter ludwigii TaxID=299767 RepID=G8LLZ4_9ENTR|nr:hypothetical protein EcWSU1_00638 [Enterobacter ludwigii]
MLSIYSVLPNDSHEDSYKKKKPEIASGLFEMNTS